MEEHLFVDLLQVELDYRVGQILPKIASRKIYGVCLAQLDDSTLSIAVVDPGEIAIYDYIDLVTEHRFKAELVQADPELLELAHEFIYDVSPARRAESWSEWLQSKRFGGAEVAIGAGDDVSGEAVELVETLITEGISLRASDLHFETYPEGLLVRYRMDGVLRLMREISSTTLAAAVVKRLKVLANVDVAQSRITQGGRISLQIGANGYDLRLSLVPVPGGESVVLRVLNKGAFDVKLVELGMAPAALEVFQDMIQEPHGLILTCGPTGSGKSTTLYASLKQIQRPDRKLLTVEDPIEYRMPGITQVQVNRSASEAQRQVTFASALREFLRHDPDVILVGEVRDEETAHVCVQAALTGHLVLSTIHTNSAVGIVGRLQDMGVKPYLIASTLIGGISQRLVRRLCSSCLEWREPGLQDQKLADSAGHNLERVPVSPGCEACLKAGYRGRVAIYEVLPIVGPLRQAIETEQTATAMAEIARSHGVRSLLQEGLDKVSQGLVSIAEVRRVCSLR